MELPVACYFICKRRCGQFPVADHSTRRGSAICYWKWRSPKNGPLSKIIFKWGWTPKLMILQSLISSCYNLHWEWVLSDSLLPSFISHGLHLASIWLIWEWKGPSLEGILSRNVIKWRQVLTRMACKPFSKDPNNFPYRCDSHAAAHMLLNCCRDTSPTKEHSWL